MHHAFIHIGDTHLGPNGRQDDRLNALDQIVPHGEQLATEKRLAAWLWPGDLFHAKSTIDDRNALAPRLQRMAALAPVVIVYGNHDVPGDLEVFARLESPWPIHVISSPRVIHVETATQGEAAIFCLPYPHRAGLVSGGAAHDDLGQQARAALEPMFIAAAAELEAARADGEIPLFVGHVNVGGALSSAGQPQIGMEIELDPSLLARLGSIYKGLNHIHKHQVVAGAVYAGSICRLDFGEQEAKGFIEVTCLAGEFTWRFVSLDVPAQYHVEGELSRDGFAVTSINGETAGQVAPELWRDPEQWRGADVRVRYRYVKAEISALDVAKIHAEFAGARSLKLDAVPVLAHEVRAPEIAAAATLDDKVRAYCERHGVTWTDCLASKLADLQRQSPEALLTSVSARLAVAGVEPGDVEVRSEPAVAS
jgi:DNA repair exonuclease SbcCD nuclease subunit